MVPVQIARQFRPGYVSVPSSPNSWCRRVGEATTLIASMKSVGKLASERGKLRTLFSVSTLVPLKIVSSPNQRVGSDWDSHKFGHCRH